MGVLMHIKIHKACEQAKTTSIDNDVRNAGIPNSSMISMMGNNSVLPDELEALPGRELHHTQELGDLIQTRLGVQMPGIRIFEDDGLQEKYGQRAYARGNEIHMAKGEYDPYTEDGQNLLLHEAGHIVQQGSGMTRGSGILQDPALEAQADSITEAPASFSMPSSASGSPIQGWNPFKRKKKDQPEEIEMDDLASLPAPGLDTSGITGLTSQAIAQTQPSRWSRFKGAMGTAGGYMAKPFKALLGVVGGAVSGKVQSIKRKHQRAVDQLNNGRDDYDAMSRWERFKWSAKNPLARMMASHYVGDTRERNAHERGIERMSAGLKATTHYDIGDAAYDPSTDPYYQIGGKGKPGLTSISQEEMDMAGMDESLGETGGIVKDAFDKVSLGSSLLAPGAGFFARSAAGIKKSEQAVANAEKYLEGVQTGKIEVPESEKLDAEKVAGDKLSAAKSALPLTGAERGFGVTSGAFGAISSGASAISNSMGMASSIGKGNASEAATLGLSTLGNLASMGGNIAKLSAYASGSLGAVSTVTGQVIPGINVGVGGLQMLGGGVRLGSATAANIKMKNRMAKMREAGPMTRDQERMYRTLHQAKRMAAVRQVEGGMDMVSGALNVTGSGLTLGGVTAPVGAIVSGAGTAVGVAKGLVSDKMKKARRTDVVEEELGLSPKIQELVGKGIKLKDAKHAVLKSMGFASGKRKEAFQHITMRRATDLHKRANSGSDPEAAKTVSDLGLYKFGGKYSLQGIAEMLGMDSTSSWQSQMAETAHSRDRNPFAAHAEANRESIRQKQMEGIMKGAPIKDKLMDLKLKSEERKKAQGVIY